MLKYTYEQASGGKTIMHKKFKTKSVHIDQNAAIFEIADVTEWSTDHIQASGRMLVDSDEQAFVYIIEVNEEYKYVSFPFEHWSYLQKIKNEEILSAYLLIQSKKIELVQLKEELDYLIENIDGNGNYGDKMGELVKEVFGE